MMNFVFSGFNLIYLLTSIPEHPEDKILIYERPMWHFCRTNEQITECHQHRNGTRYLSAFK